MKTEYEKAVDEFVEADKKYAELEEQFMSGLILKELVVPGVPVERLIEEFKLVLEELKKLLEDRNSKLLSAKNAMRAAVQLGVSQWRGPDGKPTTLTYGPFTASSFTRRSIDASTLLELAKKKGFFDEMMALKGVSKDGRECHLVRHEPVVDYEGIMQWLKLHGHTDVIEGVYDEREGTPTVKGPKPLAFFGEKKKDD
jgi:hypothetical protein